MPHLPTAQEWLTQSHLLIKARPSSTRITTKYTFPPTITKRTRPRRKAPPSDPIALLTLKTYDQVSGTTLKYETNKAAEVGRLIQILGRLGRGMAGLPEIEEEVVVKKEEEDGLGVGTPIGESERQLGQGQSGVKVEGKGAPGGGGGGGGKGKKKKGKK